MAKLARDFITPATGQPTLHPRETFVASGLLAAVDAAVTLACDGTSTVAVDLRGTFSLTFVLEGSVDGVNWTPIAFRDVQGGSFIASRAGTTGGTWRANCATFRLVRARCSAFTSGAATVVLTASNGVFDDAKLAGSQTPLIGTATGLSGAAVTLTIAASGAGLRHYITYIRIDRFASALLVAAAAPVVVTSTNLPGPLAWSIPAEAAAQGTIFAFQEDFTYPLVSSAQNAATTIVCPATTNVIWRATAGYFDAP